MTGLREELDVCVIAHQIEINNAFLNDLLSNTLYTSSNCHTKGEGEGEGAELGPSQGGQKHPWTPTLIYALMMRL